MKPKKGSLNFIIKREAIKSYKLGALAAVATGLVSYASHKRKTKKPKRK